MDILSMSVAKCFNSKAKPTCTILIILLCLFNAQGRNNTEENKKLNGIWESETKDLKVQVYYQNEKVFARMVYFPCNHTLKLPMEKHFDIKNPNPKLRTRTYLDVVVLSDLVFEKSNTWSEGKIYNPVTGKTYSASLKLINNNRIEVRAYIGFEFIGESIFFNKLS